MPHPSITAATYPHKPAIIMGATGELVTYAQLDDRSNQGAQLFRSLGLQAGDHIALMMDNTRQFLEICWAAQRAGLIYTPINAQLHRAEVSEILENCGAKLFIGSIKLAEIAERVRSAATTARHFYLVGGIRAGFKSWEEAVDACPAKPIADERNGVPMLYSGSGSDSRTGVFIPPVSDDVLAENPLAESIGVAFGFSEETVYLSPAPLYNPAPLHYNLMTIHQGGTTVVMEAFEPERALKLIEEHRVTHSQWQPLMFVRMLKLSEETRKRYDLSSMQVAIHAGAPCPVDIKEQMIAWWGEVIVEYYAAEGIGFTAIDAANWLLHKGSVGPAMVGEVHIVDDAGEELPTGEIGTVFFAGEQANFSYHNEPAKTAEAFNDKGWATAGDKGYVDEEGYLYLTDRKSFMIVSGAANIAARDIENLLITHDKVADVAVFGTDGEALGEQVQAMVEPTNWADATDEVAIELMEWVRERISQIRAGGNGKQE